MPAPGSRTPTADRWLPATAAARGIAMRAAGKETTTPSGCGSDRIGGGTGALACTTNGVVAGRRCGAIAHWRTFDQPKCVRGTTTQPAHEVPAVSESPRTGRLLKPSGHQLT